ncbi:hypothetical protein BDZ45DRAFT_805227 [Acephala macrosclerotiorum]|nr:hypothetical protein BDZ45DRAFT_805227 [Acephala macrosclerotiorum]
MAENRGNDLFNFEPGDVSITVMYDGEICTGRVSSHAMALGSPVWEKFLFPPWSESKETKDLEGQDIRTPPVQRLNFVEDDGEALLILLRIAHLQFKEIPAALSSDHLFNLAILVDEYNCIGIIRPWLANEETEWKKPGRECWLFIAWAFGRDEIFRNLALKMVKEIVVDADGVTFTSSGERMPQPMPGGIIEYILDVRQATIDKLLGIPYAHVDRYENTNDIICKRKHGRKACDALAYGSLVRGLQIAGLWPRKKPEEIHISIDQLASTLESLEIFVLPGADSSYDYGYSKTNRYHDSCSVHNFIEQVRPALSGIQFPVPDSHRRHMEAQKTSRPIKIAATESVKLFGFRHGNAQIKITDSGELVVGKVSSHCMALASKVWQNLIFDPRTKHQEKGKKSQGEKEDNIETRWVNQTHKNQPVERQGPSGENNKQETSSWPVNEVDFRDNDSEALLILLRIAHLQYNDVPTTLAYETLLDVAVLCNRYSCVELVEPWLSQWLSHEEKSLKEAGHESWLFIAWVFGRDKVFSDLAVGMVREATTNDDGKCLTSSGADISGPVPPMFLERIQELREELIRNLLEVPYSRLDKYESTIASICCQPGNNKEGCDAAIYGSIARGVQKAGLWPRKRAGDIHMSANELATKVKDIRIYSASYGYEGHHSCGSPTFRAQVTNILSAVPSQVLDIPRRDKLQK